MVAENTREVLVLGMGGGTSIKQLLHFYPEIEHIDAVDIDPEVVQLAGEYFDIKPSERLSIHVADARVYLAQTDKKYDFIEVDLFHQGPYIPFYVATKEFFELVRSRLNDGGVMVYNVLGTDEEDMLLKPISATAASAFPSLMYVPTWKLGPGLINTALVAFRDSVSYEEARLRIENCEAPGLEKVCIEHARCLKKYVEDDSARIFTDDLAPVERENFLLIQRHTANMKQELAE
jgi:spermidine synthase